MILGAVLLFKYQATATTTQCYCSSTKLIHDAYIIMDVVISKYM